MSKIKVTKETLRDIFNEDMVNTVMPDEEPDSEEEVEVDYE